MRLNWFWFGTPGLHWRPSIGLDKLAEAILRATTK